MSISLSDNRDNPDRCRHDWRKVHAHAITGQMPDGRRRLVGFCCCRCGKSPFDFMATGEFRQVYRQRAGAFLDWPEERRITDFEIEDRMSHNPETGQPTAAPFSSYRMVLRVQFEPV